MYLKKNVDWSPSPPTCFVFVTVLFFQMLEGGPRRVLNPCQGPARCRPKRRCRSSTSRRQRWSRTSYGRYDGDIFQFHPPQSNTILNSTNRLVVPLPPSIMYHVRRVQISGDVFWPSPWEACHSGMGSCGRIEGNPSPPCNAALAAPGLVHRRMDVVGCAPCSLLCGTLHYSTIQYSTVLCKQMSCAVLY